jgi:hypothetical protein
MSKNKQLTKEMLEKIILEELENLDENVFGSIGQIAKAGFQAGADKFKELGAEKAAKNLTKNTNDKLKKVLSSLTDLEKANSELLKNNDPLANKFNTTYLRALSQYLKVTVQALQKGMSTRGAKPQQINKVLNNYLRALNKAATLPPKNTNVPDKQKTQQQTEPQTQQQGSGLELDMTGRS